MDAEVDDGHQAPWRLAGTATAALARGTGDGGGGTLPGGLERLPGPALVLAVRWERSPMGPYDELAVLVPARVGARPGWCVTTMVVDSEASRAAGRRHWGLPKEVGQLAWDPVGGPELGWADRGVSVRCRPVWRGGPALPFVLPAPLLQRHDGGVIAVPGRARGRARPAVVEIAAPEGDPLAPLSGRHAGVHLSRVELWLGEGVPLEAPPAPAGR